MNLGLALLPMFAIDVLDSFIEEESVSAITNFLVAIALHPSFSLLTGVYGSLRKDKRAHEKRWYDAYNQENVAFSLGQCS